MKSFLDGFMLNFVSVFIINAYIRANTIKVENMHSTNVICKYGPLKAHHF